MVNNAEAQSAIGLACLMANDLMLPFVPKPSDGTLERLANILPFSDYVPGDHYSMEIARSQKMFDEISQSSSLRSRRNFFDVKTAFEDATGLSHSVFAELIFGCTTKFLNVTLEDLSSLEALILRETFFQKSAVSLETAKRFFGQMTITESELAIKIRRSSDRPGDDFTIFQAYPLIEVAPGLFTCIDPGFLVEKAGRGLYWTLFLAVSNEVRSKLASFWGTVFESYVNSILQQSYMAKGALIPEPKFPNGDEAFDACLVEGTSLVVFEHKSSTIRADAKYGGDVRKLREQLHLKFIDGEDEGAKGVAQLVKNLVRFLRGENLATVACKDIRTIYPSLVCLDNSVAVPYMGRYFNEQFRQTFPRREFRRHIVTPIMTMNISDIENLLGYLQTFRMSDILDSYYFGNRSMLTPLSSSEVPLLKGVLPGQNLLLDEFGIFANKIEHDLFPKEARQ